MKIKNVIFDLGAVMFEWNPQKISENFTNNIELQNQIQEQLFHHQDWIDFDCALITEKEIIKRVSKKFPLSELEAGKLIKQAKESLTLISKTLDILIEVKAKKLNAYCLSNISPEWFAYLAERHTLFELFNGTVTSGAENTGKPDKRIFEILLERYQLNAEESLFIDDSTANIDTAMELGISTVTFKATTTCYHKIYSYLSI